MRVSRFYICLLIMLIVNCLHAQEYLAPELLSVENGLSSRQVNAIAIDKKGFLWTGTKYGLNRYNGYRFRHFFTSTTGADYPGIQIIQKIKTDAAGNLWVLNDGGVNRIDFQTGAISKYPVSVFDAVYNPESVLKDMFPANDGTVWILSDRSLTMLSADEVINTYLIPADLLSEGLVPTSLAADPNGNIWIGTTGGLLLYSIQQKTFKEIAGKNTQGLLSHNHVNCLFLDHENSLWVGTSNGLNRIDPVDFGFYAYYPAGSSAAQPGNQVLDIAGSGLETMVLATADGIITFNSISQVFRKIYQTSNYTNTSVAIDSSGIIWAGTSKGILKIRESKLDLLNFTSQSSNIRLAYDHIIALAHGPENKIFIGYYKDGFGIADTKTYSIRNFTTLGGGSVVGFYPFRDKGYLILTEHDIELFSSADNRRESLFTKYSFLRRDLFENTKINCLYVDGDNTIYVGTDKGIQSIRIDSARHRSISTLSYQNQRTDIGHVYDLQKDLFGNIWMGTDDGLIFYNPVKGNYNRITPYDIDLLNTEHKAVYTIAGEKTASFWLGTSAGVYRMDVASHEFSVVTDKPEIMNASVKVLNVDPSGNLWIGTETGLFNYIKTTNTIKSYDLKEGLVNDSYTAIISGLNGQVYLGGYQGLSIVSVPPESRLSKIPNVVITRIRYMDNEPNKEDLYYQVPDTIILPWHRKPLLIEFAVLDLTRPEFNQFKYSFGKTKENVHWQALGSQNYVILDRLGPGRYRLKVTGSDSEMNWNSTGTSLVIIVEAPYWRSKFGLAVMVIAGLFLVFLFFRFWIRQFFNLSRENQEREMFAKQIMLQKEELTLKNKSITDSINYAKRIQTAMLPPYKMFKSIFPSSFILFMPKDIVSGDFYWVNKLGNRIFVSAVDCTGHGVPGAFMSIIGFELFRKITNIEGLTRPSDILNRLNDDFHEIFKDVDNVVLRDGMDVAFCSIDKKDMILEFAGAFNPLYLIRDNKIMEVKGDRFAIGLDETNFREQTFKNHIIPIQKGDIVYIFSDGFSDQFGGPDGKKYKYRRFRHLLLNLHQLPMEKQHEILENNVMEWRGVQEQVDDILVIGIKIDF
jgi:ligand-binding sensor domain-containing protein/serine phosphatase RsbU (regulator of sigma subunit)